MEIKIFNNPKFGDIRVLRDENNEPWLVLADVCKVLGLKNVSRVKNRLYGVTAGKGISEAEVIDKLGRKQKVTIINESNFYKVVFQSKKEEALIFQDWVTSEVLPAIRKYGGYLTPEKIKEALTDPDVIIDLAMRLKEAEQKRVELQEKVTLLTHTNKTYTSTEIAKELGFKSAIELNKKLEEMGIQYKVNKTWVLTAKYADKGYEEIKQDTKNGQPIYHRKWTQKGREFILSLFKPTAIIANDKPFIKQSQSTLPSTLKAPLQAD